MISTSMAFPLVAAAGTRNEKAGSSVAMARMASMAHAAGPPPPNDGVSSEDLGFC
jgi:hypothetical protein